LDKLVFKSKWNCDNDSREIKEWSDEYIAKLIKENAYFRKGIVNLFFEGATVPFLAERLPLFELKKLEGVNQVVILILEYRHLLGTWQKVP
jgi:thiamine phosphate synthase YjbQ (UPF0047 family)